MAHNYPSATLHSSLNSLLNPFYIKHTMYMYNVIVYVWDLSNEQPVTIIEHRTRFFVPDCLCRLEKNQL